MHNADVLPNRKAVQPHVSFTWRGYVDALRTANIELRNNMHLHELVGLLELNKTSSGKY